jgi:two-component system, cell cycle response regulator
MDAGGDTLSVRAFESKTESVRIDDPLEHGDSVERFPCLVILTGKSAGSVRKLTSKETTLGRSLNADMVLDDSSVSRLHARLVRHDVDGFTLVDMDSTNGTLVGGERVATRQLCEGDKIQLGANIILKFTCQDAIEEQLQTHLYESATRDPLTGAANRNYFFSRYEDELAYAERHQTGLSVLMMDLDHFKEINDTHGHLAGDRVLAEVVELMASTLRREDHLARFGGEEFVLLARMDQEGAIHLAERILSRVSAAPLRIRVNDRELSVPVTISIGVASLSKAFSSLLEGADEALYAAKRLGRNRLEVHQRHDAS